MNWFTDSFNLDRKDSGWLRFLVSLIFAIVSVLFLWAGYELILSGVAGDWKIVSSFKDWELYVTSISPGLFVILLGALIFIFGLPRQF